MNDDGTVDDQRLHGVMAEFSSAETLLQAVRRTRAAGYQRVDAYAPFPVEGMSEALELPPSRIPYFMLAGAFLGASIGLGMQYFANLHAYPMNIGGRPLNAWPAFVPPTVLLTILFAVLCGLLALLLTTGLPLVYHPVFNYPDFRRASRDGFSCASNRPTRNSTSARPPSSSARSPRPPCKPSKDEIPFFDLYRRLCQNGLVTQTLSS